jgi:AcrR family transcriptional regulator
MARPTRKKQIPNLHAAILGAAWEQLAQEGAPTLSLRAIARRLKITAPAIYHYFADRDALVTALIIDAYTTFGDALIRARDSLRADDPAGRLAAIGFAYREWAHANPQRYQLIFGTPIPGYVAPLRDVLPSAARSLSALVSVVEQLRLSGRLSMHAIPPVKPDHRRQFDQWRASGGEADPLSLSAAMIIWARVHGLVSLEIQGNLPAFGPQGDALFRMEVESILRQFIRS